ncbi:hypothetical protein C8R44DRAFT_748223 [Mycena epipterygia]|nr:hypothetical protein C8R44DRAFT_748223 [Mycena epipterygia]
MALSLTRFASTLGVGRGTALSIIIAAGGVSAALSATLDANDLLALSVLHAVGELKHSCSDLKQELSELRHEMEGKMDGMFGENKMGGMFGEITKDLQKIKRTVGVPDEEV